MIVQETSWCSVQDIFSNAINCMRLALTPKRICAMQLEFFRGIPLERESIALTLTPEGRPKGEAYVDFPTEDAQKEALGRHKEAMGERYIELFLSTKANMVQVCCGSQALRENA